MLRRILREANLPSEPGNLAGAFVAATRAAIRMLEKLGAL